MKCKDKNMPDSKWTHTQTGAITAMVMTISGNNAN